MEGKEKGGEEPRESTFPWEHVSTATIPLISVPSLHVDLESPAAAVLDTHACLKAMLPERPNAQCRWAWLTAQLSRQRLWGRWSGCSHVMCGGLQRESGGGADAQARTVEANRSVLSLRILYTNYLAMRRQKGKGMLLPGNVPCVHLMHVFELLNRWKPNSLVAGENL